MDELDNILNDNSPSENPVETEDSEPKEKEDFDEKESDSNKLEVEDQENENSSDRQVDDEAQVPQEGEEQETEKKEEEDQEAQNAQDDEEKDASEGETKKERRKRKKEKKSKRDKKDKKDKKKKKKSKDDEKFKIFGDSDEEDDDAKEKDADFDTADVDVEEEGKRALEEIVEKKKEKKKKRSRDEKKKTRSSKKKKSEEDPDAAPEPTAPISNEPNDFDLVIESLKKGHRRRKADGPPEGSDEFVRDFVRQMDLAADEDIRANQQHLPALNKVKLLPEVSSQLAKKFLHEIFVSAGVLNALKKWLDPLPDGSLPNIKVRETVLRGLIEMGNHVQTEDLRESGIGRAIMLLSKHPQETLLNKKNAKTLIELWSRPIFNLSSKYKDMYKAEDRFQVAESDTNAPTPSKSVKAVSTDFEHTVSGSPSAKSSKDNPSLHAKIPDKIALDFKIMPRANEEAARLLGLPKKGGDTKGTRKSPGNKKVERAVTMSIEGRGVYH